MDNTALRRIEAEKERHREFDARKPIEVDGYQLQTLLGENSTLSTPCAPMDLIQIRAISHAIPSLLLATQEWHGYALAANQIGLTQRFFVLRSDAEALRGLKPCLKACSEIGPAPAHEPIWPEFFANPEIIARTGKQHASESCLSVPHPRPNRSIRYVAAKVKRAEVISVSYLDRNGEPQRLTATGLLAQVIQHEIDHLDGVLFLARMSETDAAKTHRLLQSQATDD